MCPSVDTLEREEPTLHPCSCSYWLSVRRGEHCKRLKEVLTPSHTRADSGTALGCCMLPALRALGVSGNFCRCVPLLVHWGPGR